MKRILLYLSILSLLMISCRPSRSIAKSLNRATCSVSYLYDSPLAPKTLKQSVSLGSVEMPKGAMLDTSTVVQTKSWMVPLLIVNSSGFECQCYQGKSMIKENIPTFFRQSLQLEMNRSGVFVTDTLGKGEYMLDISIDTLTNSGPYRNAHTIIFFFIDYTHYFYQSAGPSLVDMVVKYKLKKADKVLYSNRVRVQCPSVPLSNKSDASKDNMMGYYAAAMTEAVSMSIKRMNEQIVFEVNRYLLTHQKE